MVGHTVNVLNVTHGVMLCYHDKENKEIKKEDKQNEAVVTRGAQWMIQVKRAESRKWSPPGPT